MPQTPQEASERGAVFAALSQGQFNQFYHLQAIIENIEQKAEGAGGGSSLPDFSDLQSVEAPSSDARSADVREVVASLVEQYNALIGKLKGVSNG